MTDKPNASEKSDAPAIRQATHTRGRNGRYQRSVNTAQRDAQAAELRSRGLSYRQIAAEMGYRSVRSAQEAVTRALKEIVEDPANDVRVMELGRLDDLYATALEVLQREHVVVSTSGRIVYDIIEYARDGNGNIRLDDDGRPVAEEVTRLRDDGPTLAAIKTLLQIQERRAKLLGLDAPVKAEVGGKLKYEVVGVDLDSPGEPAARTQRPTLSEGSGL
jgi:hypothetical protein